MSGVYWGIVSGIAALVITLMISMTIYYQKPNNPKRKAPGGPFRRKMKTGSAIKPAA